MVTLLRERRLFDRPRATVIGSKIQSATCFTRRLTSSIPRLCVCASTKPIPLSPMDSNIRSSLTPNDYRDFPDVIWGNACRYALLTNSVMMIPKDVAEIQANPNRFDSIDEFDIIFLVKLWKIEAERTDVVAEVYDFAHSRPKKMIEDFCKSHHSERDGPEG